MTRFLDNHLFLCAFLLLCNTAALASSLVDARGRELRLDSAPQRVATAFVAADEIAYEILHRTDALERLIAVSTAASDPEYSAIAKEAEKIPGRVGTDLEALVVQKPDLVILATFNRPELVKQLDLLGIKSFVIGNFSTFKDISRNIETIGKLLHASAAAIELTIEFQKRLKQSQRFRPTIPVAMLSWGDDGSSMGKNTLMDEIISYSGGINLAGSQLGIENWARVADEKIPELRPEWIICGGDTRYLPRAQAAMLANPGWKQLPAVQKGKIIIVPQRYLSSASHHIAVAIDIISAHLRGGSLKGSN